MYTRLSKGGSLIYLCPEQVQVKWTHSDSSTLYACCMQFTSPEQAGLKFWVYTESTKFVWHRSDTDSCYKLGILWQGHDSLPALKAEIEYNKGLYFSWLDPQCQDKNLCQLFRSTSALPMLLLKNSNIHWPYIYVRMVQGRVMVQDKARNPYTRLRIHHATSGIRFQCILILWVNAHVSVYKDTLRIYLCILIFSVYAHAYADMHMDS